MPKEIKEENVQETQNILRKRRRKSIRENKIIAERITKKCVFEEIDGTFSPIKKAVSHEVEITDNHQGIK